MDDAIPRVGLEIRGGHERKSARESEPAEGDLPAGPGRHMGGDRILTSRADIPTGDYVSEGLEVVIPDACFPNMVIGDKAHHPWPYLRREVGHNWYCDRRGPEVGFLNRDETTLLYNLALQFRGKPALEVGAWMGWSTCHLALAGLSLDVIDPVFSTPDNAASVRESLAAAGVLAFVRLHATASPDGVRKLAELHGGQWNFFFIDGDHEGDGPERDARECLRHAAEDAMIVFHDLVSPHIERGLDVFRREGWNVILYQTLQIMGVAWRGDARPVTHVPDPAVAWNVPLHLAKYRISGNSVDAEVSRLSQRLVLADLEISRLEREITARDAEVGRLHGEVATRDVEIERLHAE